jgi:transposase
MARAYSDDLRSKILRAYEHGRQGLEAIAEQFGVSYGYTKKIRRQQLQSGRVERSLQARHGPISRVDARNRRAVAAAIAAAAGWLSRTRLWEVLQRLELRRKKNPSTRASRTAPRRNNGAKSGGKR